MNPVAKALIAVGVFLVVVGLGWQMGWVQSMRLGRLPGDIIIERENFRFYFPITTGLLISAVLSLVAWLVRR